MKQIKNIIILGVAFLALSCTNDDSDFTPNTEYTTAKDLLQEIDFQGYAIITKANQDLVREGFGLANTETGLTQTTDLQYRIGSVSKTLTAAAIVQLKRDGLLSGFDQTLNEFDDEFPFGSEITVADLLSHQSGIPDYQLVVENLYENEHVLDPEDIYDVIVEMIQDDGLNFTPGEAKQYSNSNYLIAALLIEQLSGVDYHQYMQNNLLDPLAMHATDNGLNSINLDTHAQGYHNGAENSTYPIQIAFGAGNFSSTPTNMEIWTNAVANNWFSSNEQEEIFAQNVPNGYTDFGLGWFTTKENNTTLYWHGGDINGYWSMIGFVPKHNATIVLLSNQQDDEGLQRNTVINQLLQYEFN